MKVQEGRLEMSPKRYPLVIERTGTGYSAYSPDVPGCAAAGDTEEETRRNFHDALVAHFEAMREVGEPIPEPSSSVDYVEVAA
jgi:predicted RNase H-like HicB family nuclease